MTVGCADPSWHADGYCDDVNNNEACFFDGGDCCGSDANTQYCTECQCLEWGEGEDTISQKHHLKDEKNKETSIFDAYYP